MILVVICFAVVFFISWLWLLSTDELEPGGPFLLGILFGVIGGIVGLIIAGIISANTDPYEVTTKTPIVLMADGTATSGQVSLFSGYIETNEVYRYYQRDSNGGLRLYSKLTNESVVYEDSANPYILTICLEKPDAWYRFNDPGGLYDCTYEFHIPEGSVSTQIVLDGD